LTITTPEQAQAAKHKKSKQQALQQLQHQQQLLQQQLLISQQASHSLEQSVGARCGVGLPEETDPAEKSDQRCAIIILMLFSAFAVAVAWLMHTLLAGPVAA
jgi:Flp pilus assembly protein TadB